MESARKLVEVPDRFASTLLSPARPIVLLKKREGLSGNEERFLEQASPGLGTVGIYLPYSGIHHLLFKALEDIGSSLDAIVMTSANPPGEPMAVDLENALKMKADGYLIHDRRISARCDDSVIVPNPFNSRSARTLPGPFSIRSFPIRKARGMIPDPLDLPHERNVLSFGAERNVTVTVSVKGRAFTSPYIGNSRHPEVLDYASQSAEKLMALFGGKEIEAVSADLHPRYETIPLAREFSEKFEVPLFRYQHHEAHAASLMVDADSRALPVLVLDGVGHGRDGLPWGGEVIGSSWDQFERLGSLQALGLPGGDSAVYHPDRIAHWLSMESGMGLDIHDDTAVSILSRTHDTAVMTTSFGRLLDALSSLVLGITWRTYDGEPAMRLESLLDRSKDPRTSLFSVPFKDNRVDVICRWKILLEELFKGEKPSVGTIPESKNAPDLVMGMLGSILDDMIEISLKADKGEKDEESRPCIGISGGVAYDLPLVRYFVNSCQRNGALPVLHSRVPPGDGGISVGQAALAGLEIEKAGDTPQT
jgi:hydrogenase maturation protein HypF